EENHILHVGGGSGRGRGVAGIRLGPDVGRGGQPQAEGRRCGSAEEEAFHYSTSSIARAPLSTMRIGRPTFDIFCFSALMPTALQAVARKSGTVTLRSSISMPSALVLPMTLPPLMPPPAITVEKTFGKCSRPPLPAVMRGVRPNSPIHTIKVESSRPRSFRSV